MKKKIDQLRDILQRPAVDAAETRRIAVHHARLLQHRKDLEREILDSVIELSEFPRGRTAREKSGSDGHDDNDNDNDNDDAASMSKEEGDDKDQDAFRSRVRLFQPSDYDDLVEERNVNGLCGYTLCGRPRPSAGGGGGGGTWAITRAGDIVRRHDLQRWCSAECARRALYVRVQLVETPAWERAGIPDIRIDLLDDGADKQKQKKKKKKKSVLDEDKARAVDERLAVDRGDRGLQRRVNVTLRDKEMQMPHVAGLKIADDKMDDEPDDGHLFVEGHRARR